MDGYGGDQVRAAERPHLDAGEPLMQRAAAGLATIVGRLLDDPAERPGDGPGSVLLLVGSGDNGGDALFAGAHLAADGRHVAVLRVGSRVHEAGLAAALGAGAVLLDGPPEQVVTDAALGADLVLDAVLGIGVHGASALRSPAREVVQAIRELARDQRAPFVVAVDVPSGIDVDTGAVADDHVLQADVTVTFGGVKAGLLRGPGATLAGRIELVDVGIADDLATVEPLVRTLGP
ncbi:NAD(P)H-hydrate epimerase [Curtobacterium sp. VKM Ac-2922]|uniref:NAD(P)H-hydrate epimerase n=1 Tax=Curtobacterium sp. VKM Ac-2922 TaxID=2929475 RepID=UPI001FB2453C|nr:NAD(P)H-hydrate epimerase [Curtobacterium sp. VKM Ac-2922]MCJ1714512.1 NAD(P)H-hydrate epimerase [Curtobacterium sp. VKM Ac-2922]